MRAPRPRRAAALGGTALLVIVIAMAGAGSAYLLYEQGPAALSPGGAVAGAAGLHATARLRVNLALNVTVTDRGRAVASAYEPHDLITNNFFRYFEAFFANAPSSGTTTSSLVDTGGTADLNYMWGTGGCSCVGVGYVAVGAGGLVEVGTSAATPARTDFAVGAPYQGYMTATSTACSVLAGSSSFTVSASENAQSSATIVESGLFVQSSVSQGSATMGTFMYAHDTFAGVAVAAGNTITAAYTWTLSSAGLNRNLCSYLASLFDNVNFGTSPGFTGASALVREPYTTEAYYSLTGTNVTWAAHCGTFTSYTIALGFNIIGSNLAGGGASTSCYGWNVNANTENAIAIAVGTGSTAFTPSSNQLNAFVQSAVTTAVSYDGAGNLFINAANVLASSATIAEAAIYVTLPYGCVGYSPHGGGLQGTCAAQSAALTSTMWAAVTFTGVAVTGSNPIGVTFEISG